MNTGCPDQIVRLLKWSYSLTKRLVENVKTVSKLCKRVSKLCKRATKHAFDKTPCWTKTHFKGSKLGPRSFILILTILKLSLNFLQVFWLRSKIKTDRTIWSDTLNRLIFIFYKKLILLFILVHNSNMMELILPYIFGTLI